MQAQKCEEFHYQNDFKLGLLRTFFTDHITKHLKHYEQCWRTPQFQALSSPEEKDLAFLDCHDRWLANLKENIVPELELRARDHLQ